MTSMSFFATALAYTEDPSIICMHFKPINIKISLRIYIYKIYNHTEIKKKRKRIIKSPEY